MPRALHKLIEPPRFALRRDEAAAAFSMSPTSFDKLVADGRFPKGYRIGAMVLWDVEQLRRHWQAIISAESDAETANPFDEVVA